MTFSSLDSSLGSLLFFITPRRLEIIESFILTLICQTFQNMTFIIMNFFSKFFRKIVHCVTVSLASPLSMQYENMRKPSLCILYIYIYEWPVVMAALAVQPLTYLAIHRRGDFSTGDTFLINYCHLLAQFVFL